MKNAGLAGSKRKAVGAHKRQARAPRTLTNRGQRAHMGKGRAK